MVVPELGRFWCSPHFHRTLLWRPRCRDCAEPSHPCCRLATLHFPPRLIAAKYLPTIHAIGSACERRPCDGPWLQRRRFFSLHGSFFRTSCRIFASAETRTRSCLFQKEEWKRKCCNRMINETMSCRAATSDARRVWSREGRARPAHVRPELVARLHRYQFSKTR